MRKLLKRIQRKWIYSVVGLWTALKEEKSIWAYLFFWPILIGLGIWTKISLTEWAILILTMFLVITIEVINTALEAAVDTISFQYNIKVKKIKDISSGATLVITLGALTTILFIFIPKIAAIV